MNIKDTHIVKVKKETRLVEKKHCLRCGCDWWPRVKAPKLCPDCKSAFWDEDRSGENFNE